MVVVPDLTRKRPTARDWNILDVAVLLDAEERPDLAEAIVARIETKMGVNPAQREALVAGSKDIQARIRSRRRRAEHLERERASQLNNAHRDLPPSQAVKSLTTQAKNHRMKAAALRPTSGRALPATRRAIREHIANAVDLESQAQRRHEAERDAMWLARSQQETVHLAQYRGEEVETETLELHIIETDENGVTVRHKRGPLRGRPKVRVDTITRTTMGSRGGGLQSAFEKGHLGSRRDALRRLLTGQHFQSCFEVSPLSKGGDPGGGGGGGSGPKGPQDRVIDAGQTLAIMERHQDPRGWELLKMVAGRDIHLRQAAKERRHDFETAKRLLRNALDVARENWREAKETKEAGAAARHAHAVHKMVKDAS